MQAVSIDTVARTQIALVDSSKSSQRVAIKQRSAPLEPLVADRLLDLLSTDNSFRLLFKCNPGRALEQVGFVKPAMTPSPEFCFFGIAKLASKAKIAEAREAIKAMLTSGLSQTTPNLDATNRTDRRKLK